MNDSGWYNEKNSQSSEPVSRRVINNPFVLKGLYTNTNKLIWNLRTNNWVCLIKTNVFAFQRNHCLLH